MSTDITRKKEELAELRVRIEHDEPYLQDDPGGHGQREQDKLRLKAAGLENEILRAEFAELKRQQMPSGWVYQSETGALFNNRERFCLLLHPDSLAPINVLAADIILKKLNGKA